jgi:hypothetical protein
VVSNATTLGMPALDRKPVDKSLLSTQLGVDVPPNPTSPSMPAQNPLLETKLGHTPARGDGTPPRVFPNATSNPQPIKTPTVHEEKTAIGAAPPPAPPPAVSPVATDAKPAIARSPIETNLDDEATTIGTAPKRPTDPMPTTAPKPTPPGATPGATPVEDSGPMLSANPRAEAKHKATSIGFPVVRNAFETQPLGLVPPAMPSRGDAGVPDPAPPTLPKSARASQPAAPRGKNPTTPPLTPRHPTPVAPVPIVRSPAKAAPVAADEEKTDLGTQPTAAATPLEAEAEASGPKGSAQPTQRSGGMRASEILAAIPAGDWTMSPDELVPHALGAEEKIAGALPAQEPTPAPAPPPVKGPPTGDWTISLDPETGWSEPAKVEKATAGNPVIAVASEKPITVQQWDEKPTGIGESKIEIDSTLMEPLKAMPADDDEPAQIVDPKPPASDPPPPLTPMPPHPAAGFPMEQSGFQQPAVPYRQSSLDLMGFVPAPPEKRKKLIIMAVAAGAFAVGMIVLLVITLGGSNSAAKKVTTEQPKESKVVAPVAIDAAAPAVGSQQVVAPEGSGADDVGSAKVDEGSAKEAGSAQIEAGSAAKVETPAPPPTGGTCKVDVTSKPTGADIYIEKQKLGTTPETIELPCGVETKLTLRKKSLPNTNRSFKPTAGKTSKLVVKLARTLFQVKVTSTPAGATITAGGKTMGVTPTTIKLPGFETTAITLKKPGYSPDTQRVNPKQNNSSHHVTLKKGRGGG